MTAPVAKRADQLVVGDRIQPGYLPAYARSGEARVMLVDRYAFQGADWVFVAFACADGDRNCTYYLPNGEVKVLPADDGEITQAIGVREPLHTGEVTEGGLVEETVATIECSPECDALAIPGAPTGLNRAWHDDRCPVVPVLDALYREAVGES
jgi:hypothetical protein